MPRPCCRFSPVQLGLAVPLLLSGLGAAPWVSHRFVPGLWLSPEPPLLPLGYGRELNFASVVFPSKLPPAAHVSPAQRAAAGL